MRDDGVEPHSRKKTRLGNRLQRLIAGVSWLTRSSIPKVQELWLIRRLAMGASSR